MSVNYLIRYEGRCPDPQGFVDYYANTHSHVMRAYPGIRSAVLHRAVEGWHDPLGVNRGETFMLGELQFDSVEALNHALASEARVRSREDARRFPPFEGKITHQAFEKLILF